jgi:hypothetical protein
MARKNYTPAERALHIIGAFAGKSRREINIEIGLGDANKRVPEDRRKELPESSFETLERYGAVTGLTPAVARALWAHCTAPKKLGDL